MTKRPQKKPQRQRRSALVRMGAIPAAVYLGVFAIVTYPLLGSISTHLFADARDGLVMVWGVWWVKTAVTELQQSPWQTSHIFFPVGVSLLSHTLTPLAGLLAILLPFLTLTQTYNFMVVLGFVSGGLTAFWLAYFITRSYWPSIVAGFIFSFSNYHFAHLAGHLNLVFLQGIPLFVLCWLILLKKPGVRIAFAGALSLLVVILCDYYYFFYCCLVALIMLCWHAIRFRNAFFFLTGKYRVPFVTFAVTTATSSGVLIAKLWSLSRKESFIGVHEAEVFSADLLSPFVYGSALRFSNVTKGFWSKLAGNTSETSVYMGVSVLVLLVLAWLWRKRIKAETLGVFYFITLFFLVCSMGPKLHVLGESLSFVPMPYRLLEFVFPPLEFSGVPARMMVIVMLCSAVISAMALDQLFRGVRGMTVFAGVLMLVMFVEFLPKTIRPLKVDLPSYVEELKSLPPGAVIDAAAPDTYHAMYYQTVHEKPIPVGKVARIPDSVFKQSAQVLTYVRQGDLGRLNREYGFRYIVGKDGKIYDLSQPTR